MKSLSRVRLLATLWTAAYQAPPSMGFSRQEYWSGMPLPSPIQLLSRVQLFANPWTAVHQASLSITNSQSLLKLMSIKSVIPSNHLILCRPLLLLPSKAVCPNPGGFGEGFYSSSPWLDLLVVQGTLKSLLQHDSSKASILWGSAEQTLGL